MPDTSYTWKGGAWESEDWGKKNKYLHKKEEKK